MYYLIFARQTSQAVKEAFRIAFILTLAVFLYRFFNIQQGNWLVITVGFLYIGGCVNGLTLKRIGKRFLGAPMGLIGSFFFISILVFFDYHIAYIIPFIWIFGFYYYFSFRDYFGFVFCFLFFFVLFYDIITPPDHEINMLNLIFSRTLATFIGGFIVLAGEFFIFPDSTTSLKSVHPQYQMILERFSDALENITFSYVNGKRLRHEYCSHFASLNKHINVAEQIIAVNKYEVFDYFRSSKELIDTLYLLCDDIRKMSLLCNNYHKPEPELVPVITAYSQSMVKILKEHKNIKHLDQTINKYGSVESDNIYYTTLCEFADHFLTLKTLSHEIKRELPDVV